MSSSCQGKKRYSEIKEALEKLGTSQAFYVAQGWIILIDGNAAPACQIEFILGFEVFCGAEAPSRKTSGRCAP